MNQFRERWQVTLWIMFVAQFVSAIGFSIIFPFLPLYVQELGTNTNISLEFWAGMVFSGQAITMAIAAPIWGAVADRFGYKLMVQRAAFGGAVLLLMMGFVRSAEELVLIRTIQGAVTGTLSASNALVASIAPRERMGYAMGTLQVGLWAGISTGPLLGGLIADSYGFRATFIVTAVLLVVSGVLVWVGVPSVDPSLPKPARQHRGAADWRDLFTATGVPIIYGLRFLSGLGRTILVPFTPLFVHALLPITDRLNTYTGLVVGVASAMGTITAIYLGRLGDRIGYRQVLVGSAIAGAISFIPQGFVTNVWQLLLLQALSGAAIGGVTPALSALLARYTPAGTEGVVYGVDSSVLSSARAAAPLIGAGVVFWFDLRGIFAATAIIYFTVVVLAVTRLPAVLPQPAPQPVSGGVVGD